MRAAGNAASAQFELKWLAAKVEARWEDHLQLCEQEEQQRRRQVGADLRCMLPAQVVDSGWHEMAVCAWPALVSEEQADRRHDRTISLLVALT